MSSKGLKVGITMRVIEAQGYSEPRDALAQNWITFIRSALPNATWLLLPNIGKDAIRSYCEEWGINRLILTGGEDIGLSAIRDETEKDLLTWASTKQIPVLGICRGMQIIADWSGVKLRRVNGHVRVKHKLQGAVTHEVNSFHNFSLVSCPPGFDVLASSPDGEIEAIQNDDLKWEGWMWHPERETPFCDEDIFRIQRLFK